MVSGWDSTKLHGIISVLRDPLGSVAIRLSRALAGGLDDAGVPGVNTEEPPLHCVGGVE